MNVVVLKFLVNFLWRFIFHSSPVNNNTSTTLLGSLMELIRPLRLILLGAPGSGKGTQTGKLLKDFPSLKQISSGDILRYHVNVGTKIGQEAERYMRQGQLIPDNNIINLISLDMKNKGFLNERASWLLDGFPRSFNQAVKLRELLLQHNSALNLVVELDVDKKTLLERVEARWIHPASGRVYTVDYKPPKVPFKDDVTGEPLVKRPDDTAVIFEKRLNKYDQEIEPIRQFYEKENILHKILGNESDYLYPKLKELVLEKFGAF